MHETMIRLYEAANTIKEWRGQSALARHLGSSPQTLKNWETRGMSKGGMLTAQEKIGCSAVWLETGRGSMAIMPGTDQASGQDHAELLNHWENLLTRERQEILDKLRVMAAHNKEVMEEMAPPRVVRVSDRRKRQVHFDYRERRDEKKKGH